MEWRRIAEAWYGIAMGWLCIAMVGHSKARLCNDKSNVKLRNQIKEK